MRILCKPRGHVDSRLRRSDSDARSARRLAPACEPAERRWILCRDDELAEAELADLLRHLRRCGRCRRIDRLTDGLLIAIRNEPIPELDDAFWERMREQIMARIRAEMLPPTARPTRGPG